MALKVIGSGFPRTGTMGLKLALNQLGFGPCYHASEFFVHPEHAPLWVRAGEGDADWDAIFDGYHSTTDAPGCFFWREILERYPTAKVLHSTRTPESWFESAHATVLGPDAPSATPTPEMKPFMDMLEKRRGFSDVNDRAAMLGWFRRHEEDVKRTVPAERLLVFEAGQGWSPLCAFLGVPVPEAPFPHVNKREQTAALLAQIRKADGWHDPQKLRTAMDDLERGQRNAARNTER